ncbi:flagellar protein FlaG [Tindallia californiensis]|uniref:flagellar protein FlaG n=1 Tax=Tindallia californiensis TaxID=159292 RepID=UPI0015A45F9A|nr:flagellar protein FlaG [Tindallia californiensis]
MIIETSNSILRPIVKPPTHAYDNFKTPRQQGLEQEKNISNPSVKKVVQESVNKVYESLQKLVENTDYNVSYRLDEATGGRQFRVTMKNSGNLVAAFPTESAIEIAERSKATTLGLIMDRRI